jgi:ABC-type glycerol-3-phosphate transport system substrate-binding protein
VPPQFSPLEENTAGSLLQARLDEFIAGREDVHIEVRVKALDGPGGLLDSLTTASASAPLAMPDLIALPRPMLETAALKGLLHPYNDLIDESEDTDWYPYASQLSHLQDSLFGLPCTGDALILVYRQEGVVQPPTALEAALQSPGPLAFPASDPQALFTLALYQAAGGAILDEQGRPFLDKVPLTQVLEFYLQAASSEFTPFWLTQLQTDDQAWDAFQKGQAAMVVTWASRYLQERPSDTAAARLPTLDGTEFTLATGWVWALSSPRPERQALAAQLAVHLTESDFLAQWTQALGYLPPRPSALAAWQDTSMRLLVEEISTSAALVPSADVLPGLAAPLLTAATQMLKQQGDPTQAAEEAVISLQTP